MLGLKDEQEFSRPIREGNDVSGRASSINRKQGGMRVHGIFWAQRGGGPFWSRGRFVLRGRGDAAGSVWQRL